jgi:UDP-glucuronate 4-epimerase
VKQIVYASSSSVYGLNSKLPFSETDFTITPNSPYASSKKAMELFAQTYSQLYDLNIIGLRFFTVYGPRGRPDMAPHKFLKCIKNDDVIYKYGNGLTSRDYTYVDDIVDGVIASMHNNRKVKCEVYNLGNNNPVTLNEFIKTCEKVVGKCARCIQVENQLGDVQHTLADISKAKYDLNYQPKIDLYEGLKLMYEDLTT